MKVRDANNSDIVSLERVKKTAVLHKDRILNALDGEFRYLVIESDIGNILGHACLVFSCPKAWPSDNKDVPYPRVIDLMICEQERHKGIGAEFMKQMESICKRMGYKHLHLSVDPKDNKNAILFYQSLGYTFTEKPKWRKWSFKDSDGHIHHGEGLDVRMSKQIA